MDLKQAVFTTKYVIEGSPIIAVYHGTDEYWQFFSKEGFDGEQDAKVVALSTILKLQADIEKILWLPAGMEARYDEASGEWKTSVSEPEEE